MSYHAGPFTFPTEARTAAFAGQLAPLLHKGDTLLLSGPIGAGKSFFARALIRRKLGNPDEDVPSPTFTLVQTYDTEGVPIWHCDLYRLTHPDEAFELGLDEAFEDAICIVEWPDRLGAHAPADALRIEFSAGEDGHMVTLAGPVAWARRLEAMDV